MTEVLLWLGDGVGVGVSTALARLRSSRLLAVFSHDVIAGDVEGVGDQAGGVRAQYHGNLFWLVVLQDSRPVDVVRVRGVAVQDLDLAIAIATRVGAEMASCDVVVTRNGGRVAEPRRGIGSHSLN